MKLLSIEARNFLCYNKLLFTFTDGVWLITGENGAGKSSIFDAVTFALYGKTRGDVDSVIRTGTGGCIVKLEFEADNNTKYKIIRERHNKTGSELSIINLNNKNVTVTRPTMSETQDKIEDIIGLNYDLFVSSAYFGQENITNFMSKSPKERKELFSDMLGLGVYRIAEAQAKDKIKELEAEIHDKQMNYNHYDSSVLSFKGEIDSSIYDKTEKEKCEMKIHTLNDRVASLGKLINKKQNIYNQYNFACELINDNEENDLKITELEQNIADTQKNISKTKHILDKFNKDGLLKELSKLDNNGDICSKCGSVIKDKSVRNEIRAIEEDIKRVEKYELKLKGLYQNLNMYKNDLESRIDMRRTMVEKLKQYNVDFNRENKDSLLKEIKGIEREQDSIVLIKKDIESKLLKMMQSKALIDDKQARVNEYTKRMIIIKKYLHKIRSIMEDYKLLAHAFSRNGIPSYILENTLPSLEIATNNILQKIMKEPFYIKFKVQKKTKSDKIKDTFDLSIFVDNIERQFNSCSGGEKVRISIAIRLAISKLLSQSTGINVKFLLIDEIEYLDTEGLEQFVNIINLIKDQFDTILIISHLTKLKNMIDNFIVIEKGVDGATIRKCT